MIKVLVSSKLLEAELRNFPVKDINCVTHRQNTLTVYAAAESFSIEVPETAQIRVEVDPWHKWELFYDELKKLSERPILLTIDKRLVKMTLQA